ncbi:cistern family PEP-CTERM protein [Phenylobacterium sp.]|uniref:cistern family PEP-CTERM protein n=1 Tax=Phenylobacterium sp. TaxID=1871053 RepID=UPI0025F18AFF|nr:cistern family PEP-CTERM protein [Phenylobacterium sp.]
MIKTSAFAAMSLALSVMATPALATDWDLVDWNGEQVWGAEWTASTKLTWDSTTGVNAWYRIYFEGYTESYMNGNEVLPGLASSVLYKLTSISADKKSWTFDYVVENASNQWVDESQVAEIAFDVNGKKNGSTKQFGGAVILDGEYRTVGKGDFDPTNNYLVDDVFDVCLTTKNLAWYQSTNTSNTCDPGTSAGPEIGETVDGTFKLTFNSAIDTLSFYNPIVAYENVEYDVPTSRSSKGGSYYYGHQHYPGCGDQDDPGYGLPVAYVPEPATWAMMIMGFGAAGTALRTRRRLAA